MKGNILLISLMTIFVVSCSKLPSKSEKNEGWYWSMRDIMVSYYRTFFVLPESADDLIYFLELNKEISVEKNIKACYLFLKKNKNDILIITLKLKENLTQEEIVEMEKLGESAALDDEYTCMFFKRKSPMNFICSISRHDSFCGTRRGMHGSRSFFNNVGDPILGEEEYYHLNEKLKSKLYGISYKYPTVKWQRKEGSTFDDVLILEYTKQKGLINICNGIPIDVDSIKYYKDLRDCLEEFYNENSLSRIIMDTYIPTE